MSFKPRGPLSKNPSPGMSPTLKRKHPPTFNMYNINSKGPATRTTPFFTEIHWNPSDASQGADEDWEFVELYNPGPDLDITGYYFKTTSSSGDEYTRLRINNLYSSMEKWNCDAGSFIFPSQSYIVIANNAESYIINQGYEHLNICENLFEWYESSNAKLSNVYMKLRFTDHLENTLDVVEYCSGPDEDCGYQSPGDAGGESAQMTMEYYTLPNPNDYDLDGIPEVDEPAFDQSSDMGGSPGGLGFIMGCTDNGACNFDSNANYDDGSCQYPENFYDCDGNCIAEVDCEGICGGSTIYTDCDGVDCGANFWDDCSGTECGDNIFYDCEGSLCGDVTWTDCSGVECGDDFWDDCDGIECGSNLYDDCDGTPCGDNYYDDCSGVSCGDEYWEDCEGTPCGTVAFFGCDGSLCGDSWIDCSGVECGEDLYDDCEGTPCGTVFWTGCDGEVCSDYWVDCTGVSCGPAITCNDGSCVPTEGDCPDESPVVNTYCACKLPSNVSDCTCNCPLPTDGDAYTSSTWCSCGLHCIGTGCNITIPGWDGWWDNYGSPGDNPCELFSGCQNGDCADPHGLFDEEVCVNQCVPAYWFDNWDENLAIAAAAKYNVSMQDYLQPAIDYERKNGNHDFWGGIKLPNITT